jgi:acyl-CoA hydrolase
MDQIAFACASKHSEHYCVTASVGSVDFLNPIEIGELVTMKANINYVGSSSMVVGIRVESENITTGEIKHCNSSYFTMVAKGKKEGDIIDVPGLLLTNSDEARRFIEAIKRKKSKQEQMKQFSKTLFDINDHTDVLKDSNVQLEITDLD